ncbi:MAG TPA: NAD-dependent epimerase/dehydratase family protein [Chloroflexota bacterium]|jgi:nucleoside-diphosphate-sugar epimerase
MSSSSRALGRLLVTGVPGWLTDALLQSLWEAPPAGLSAIRCLTEPGRTLPRGTAPEPPVPTEYVAADLRDRASLVEATRGVDTVLHAAGLLHVRRTEDWYEVNTRGTERLLDAAAANRVGRFVFISSNAAGGRSERRERLLTEADTSRPLSHYGRSKWLAEQAVAGRQGPMETVSLRPCMFYGPPVPPRHVDVYRRIVAGRMPLVGSGDYARSLTYVDNLVQGCRLALMHPSASGQIYYIADRPVYTTKQVVESMARALGVGARFLPLPSFLAPLAYRVDVGLARRQRYWQTLHLVGEADWHVGVSCAKACDELGYSPTVELDEGLRKAVLWCRSHGDLP